MLACSNLYQCQTYYSILENKDLPVCIYDGDYNVVLKNDNINAFFMGLSDSEPGNWARSFSEDGDTDEANFEADFDAEAFEEGRVGARVLTCGTSTSKKVLTNVRSRAISANYNSKHV